MTHLLYRQILTQSPSSLRTTELNRSAFNRSRRYQCIDSWSSCEWPSRSFGKQSTGMLRWFYFSLSMFLCCLQCLWWIVCSSSVGILSYCWLLMSCFSHMQLSSIGVKVVHGQMTDGQRFLEQFEEDPKMLLEEEDWQLQQWRYQKLKFLYVFCPFALNLKLIHDLIGSKPWPPSFITVGVHFQSHNYLDIFCLLALTEPFGIQGFAQKGK